MTLQLEQMGREGKTSQGVSASPQREAVDPAAVTPKCVPSKASRDVQIQASTGAHEEMDIKRL